jgi:formylglycine-generating enzyme required for sulfatase activity
MQFVFTSHSSKDKALLKPLTEALIEADIKVWIDKPEKLGYTTDQVERDFLRLHAGKQWEEEIDEAHCKSGVVLAVWSKNVIAAFGPNASESGRVLRDEIIKARDKNKLVCCRIDDTPPTDYPADFHKEQVADVRAPAELGGLIRDIKTKLRAAFFREYREDRRDEWSNDRYGAGAKLFTKLSLLLDRGADNDERWDARRRPDGSLDTYDTLDAVLEKNPEHRAFVLLGSPGSGKSTLLRHLDLEIAREGLRRGAEDKSGGPFSYFVSLRDYRGSDGRPPPDPLRWLCGKWDSDWRKANAHVQPLGELLEQDGSLLLLDALNEMPHGDPKEYEELVGTWTAFITDARSRRWKSRIVFSCRSLLYSNRLSTADNMVPHVDILPLDKATIKAFLQHYASDKADNLFDKITEAGQLELYGTAYFLKMLVEVAGKHGEIPADRAELMTAYIRKLLRREYLKSTHLIREAGPLSADDILRLGDLVHADEGWRPYELLERGPLFPQLGRLAYSMQAKGASTADTDERFQVVLDCHDALRELTPASGAPEDARNILDAACQLSILEHERARDEVQFAHQLIQEYFAGRRLAAKLDPELVRVPWRVDEVDEKLPKSINEPLPPSDSTGWEETALFAALMTSERDRFLEQLLEVNLPLAGRAAAQVLASEAQRPALGRGGRRPGLSEALLCRIRRNLLERMVDRDAGLRARIAAGKALGEMGDPRFTGHRNAKGDYEYLVPPLIEIPAGLHRIGRDNPVHTYEGPQHHVELDAFHIAQFPVTNAEWRCFMEARGYDDESWWVTEAARQWRRGETTHVARTVQWRAFRQMLRENPDYLERKLATGELSDKAADDHRLARDSSDEDFEEHLKTDFRGGRHLEPRRWRDRNFSNPLQPVVGICWYEALAYCAWLSAQTRETWRLPTEAEWEAAARLGARDGADYPWGHGFDAVCCNSFESHIRATTPVGLYLGMTRAKHILDVLTGLFRRKPSPNLADMSGNGYEWTLSRYDKVKYRYPYRKDDGREGLDDDGDPRHYFPRVLRGGSWYYSKDEARIAFRLRFHPGYHNQSTGLRLVRVVA